MLKMLHASFDIFNFLEYANLAPPPSSFLAPWRYHIFPNNTLILEEVSSNSRLAKKALRMSCMFASTSSGITPTTWGGGRLNASFESFV